MMGQAGGFWGDWEVLAEDLAVCDYRLYVSAGGRRPVYSNVSHGERDCVAEIMGSSKESGFPVFYHVDGVTIAQADHSRLRKGFAEINRKGGIAKNQAWFLVRRAFKIVYRKEFGKWKWLSVSLAYVNVLTLPCFPLSVPRDFRRKLLCRVIIQISKKRTVTSIFRVISH